MKANWLALLLALAATPFSVNAQTCNSIEGEWTLAPAASSLGTGLSFNPYFTITGVKLSIRADAGRVTQQWIFTGPHLDRTTHYDFATDGTKRATDVKDATDFEYWAVAAEWQNCTLIVSGFSQLFGLEVGVTDTYVVSRDGRELTILQRGESPISVIDRRLVFVKERQ